ncbi:MAG: imidazole glycerol phosphate synthase subunit HisH [bacterium]|nr:imidazole glycerol phosphate synthase subunit HisH [bacterium]
MIAIIDYGINNLDSVKNALDKLTIPTVVTRDPKILKQSRALVLPGVGAAVTGMQNLRESELDQLIINEVNDGKPILGICLGMQLLMNWSNEGDVDCLGVINGTVEKLANNMKVPQIGWNQVQIMNAQSPLFTDIPNESNFYFVHSYYCKPTDEITIAGTTTYGQSFCSVMAKKNIVGVQFHPEKSGKAGFQLLRNFINYFT